MNLDKLTAIVTLILTLSVASERLVEIVKGFFPEWFTVIPTLEETADAKVIEEKEARRKANVSILAVVCGIITALLASPIISSIFKDIYGNSACQPFVGSTDLSFLSPCMNVSFNGLILTLAMGLLASGGSSLWNSVLEYLIKVKDVKKAVATSAKAKAATDVAEAQEKVIEIKKKIEIL